MISDDEYLERIVAGIQTVSTSGAEVSWNEVINGRQFDVVVRFKLGTLRYLVLVEVKNRTRKIGATDMDAFVQKAEDQNANKAVFVSSVGFQRGAIRSARRHGVELFTVAFDLTDVSLPSKANFIFLRKENSTFSPIHSANAPHFRPTISVGEMTLVGNVDRVTLSYTDGQQFEVPDEQSQMNYYMKKTTIKDGRSLEDLIQQRQRAPVALNETRIEEICLDPPQAMELPDEYFFPVGQLKRLAYSVTGREGRVIDGNAQIDPGIFTSPVVYTNVFTGEAIRFTLDRLPLGDGRVSVGHFYFVPHPLMYYYCDSIRDDKVRWHLIESFQNGEKITATMTQELKYSPQFIPVSDNKILTRLRRRLDDYLARSKPIR